MIDRYGVAGAHGQTAMYQMIWTASAQENPRRGIELARALMQNVSVSEECCLKARYAEAVMIEEAGNIEPAHAAYTALIQELGQKSSSLYQWVIDDMQRRLKS